MCCSIYLEEDLLAALVLAFDAAELAFAVLVAFAAAAEVVAFAFDAAVDFAFDAAVAFAFDAAVVFEFELLLALAAAAA